ncbi:MAG: tetratricopeptide repeat protein, partial [Gammaproteobacteria bacterium]|nr:tetratricopeptide repeat protein [Gammaproteobacteria bacterium]
LHKNQNETVENSVRKDVVLEEESGGKIDSRLSREAPEEVMDTISIRKRYIPNKIKIDLAKGKQAVANGDLEFAERIFSEVLEKFPKNTEALVYMADIMGVQNKNEIARSLYAAALENSPGNLKASVGLINITRDKTSLNKASYLKQLIIDNPNRAFLHANLGDYYVGRNEWPAAQAAYFEAFAQNPENANYAFNLAVCLDQLGKGEIALRYYKQALELNKFSKSRFNENSALARVQVLTGVYQ